MANRKVLTVPHSRLRKRSLTVESFDEDLQALVKDLVDSLRVQNGIGLASPQIGVSKRVVVVDCAAMSADNPTPNDDYPGILILVNPELELSGETIRWKEGCLSVPGAEATVPRSEVCLLTHQDMTGSVHTHELGWPISGVLQHECDHLVGRLYIDYLGAFERTSIVKKIMKRKKERARVAKEYDRKMRLERKGIFDEEAYKRMTHGSGKRKKKKTKRDGKSFGRNKK